MNEYKKKLSEFNSTIEQEKQKLSQYQSKVTNNIYSQPTQNQYITPIKRAPKKIPNLTTGANSTYSTIPKSTTNNTNTSNKSPSAATTTRTPTKPSVNNNIDPKTEPSKPSTSNNKDPSQAGSFVLGSETQDKTKINLAREQQQRRQLQQQRKQQQQNKRAAAQQQLRQQLSTLKQYLQALITSHNQQEENRVKQQEQRIRRMQKQRKQRQQHQKRKEKQFQQFRRINNELRNTMQQKINFVQTQFQIQLKNWKELDQKYKQQVYKLNQKNQEKDLKIQQLIYKLAELREQLKAVLQKCELQNKIIKQLREQTGNLKQQNTEIKLQNKNVKADNKVVITHLDKLIKEQSIDRQKTARQIFQERERRVLQSLYSKTITSGVISSSPTPKKQQWLPSQRDELTNRVKYEKVLDEYKDHRQQCCRKIRQLQNQIRVYQNQIQIQRKKVEFLQKNLQKMTDLRNIQKESNHKRERIIGQYKKQVDHLMQKKHEGQKSEQFYVIPRVKQRVGVISRLKKIPQL